MTCSSGTSTGARQISGILKTILILTACLFAISCGGSKNGANSSDKKKIKLAAVSFNIDEVNNKVAIDALKAKGYEAVAKFGETVIYKKV